MGFKQELQKRIERKQQELMELDYKIREITAYLQGLQDTFKMLPKDETLDKEVVLRPGSAAALARDAIRARGVPMHISEILSAIKKTDSKANRLAVAGSLAAYVRKNSVFTRPSPNTFGLIELDEDNSDDPEIIMGDDYVLEPTPNAVVQGIHKTKTAS